MLFCDVAGDWGVVGVSASFRGVFWGEENVVLQASVVPTLCNAKDGAPAVEKLTVTR